MKPLLRRSSVRKGNFMRKYADITGKDASDSGQAFVLILLILGLFLGGRVWLWLAVAALVVNMASPGVYRRFAHIWLNFSHILGAAVSRVVLTFEFFLLVLPIGLIRRLMGRDPMALKKWKRGDASVFVERNHTYTPADLKNPY